MVQFTSIGSGIAVSLQTVHGLGRGISVLTADQITGYQKVCCWSTVVILTNCSQAEYANKLLYIATLALAKLSIISLLMILTASDLHRNLGIALACIISLWGFVSEFVGAFECGSSEPWQFLDSTTRCLDQVCWQFFATHESWLTLLDFFLA
jgi:hypothetical protein